MAALSPASSPRLPSPPPIAEDQIGPTSPGVSLFEDHGKLPGQGLVDTGASRRIRPGTKAEDMAEGPPLVPLQDIDSAFQLTEHLKALHYHHTHPPDSTSTQPISPEVAKQLSHPPEGVDKNLYLYELARLLIQKTNSIIVALFGDSPPCSSQTCPEMRASEWQYLCAVHEPPKSCCAIDYCCHTLDWAATSLTSSKMFPSRLGLAPGGVGGGLEKQMKEITNIFRRVYRIFAHAWFQHREVFWKVEGKSGLYVLFKTVCDEYGIIQVENYTIPPEAEGLEATPTQKEQDEQSRLKELKQDSEVKDGKPMLDDQTTDEQQPAPNTTSSAGDTTKRHRHTISDRSTSVSSVIHEEVEEDEDEGEQREKLVLEQQSTSLHEPEEAAVDIVQTTDETDEETEPADDEIISGVKRSNTIKAPSEPEAVKETVGEQQPAEPASIEASKVADEEPVVEAMEPEPALAADADIAAKTAAD